MCLFFVQKNDDKCKKIVGILTVLLYDIFCRTFY